MEDTFEITDERDNIIIRLDKNAFDRQVLSRFLRYLEMESLRKRSELSEEEAAEMADEIDRKIWEKIKHKYLPE